MSEPQAQPASGRNMITIVIVSVAALLLIIAYVIVLKGFSREGDKRSSYISDKANAGADNIEANINVTAIDPVKGDLTARVSNMTQTDDWAKAGVAMTVNTAKLVRKVFMLRPLWLMANIRRQLAAANGATTSGHTQEKTAKTLQLFLAVDSQRGISNNVSVSTK